MNSVRREIENNEDRYISSIRQMFNTPSNANKVIAVVEGDDDEKLYSTLLNQENVTVFAPSPGGCGKFQMALEALNDFYHSRLIVIKDADFDHLNGKTYSYGNLFLTDGHDAEMMMLDEEAEEKICVEYLEDRKTLVQAVEQEIKHVSYIKWYNCCTEGLNLQLEPLTLSYEFYDGNHTITIEEGLSQLFQSEANANKTVTKSDIEQFEFDHPDPKYKELENGHDVCDGICRKINWLCQSAHRKRKTVGSREIGRLLRANYSVYKFSKTTLYADIKEWERNVGKTVLRNI